MEQEWIITKLGEDLTEEKQDLIARYDTRMRNKAKLEMKIKRQERKKKNKNNSKSYIKHSLYYYFFNHHL